MKKTLNRLIAATGVLGLLTGMASAGIIYIDFGDQAGAITAPETYNTLTTLPGGTGSPLLSGQNFLNLVDTNGDATGMDLNVQVTGDANAAGMGEPIHDPVAGIDDNALDDGFWVNNGALGDDVDNQVNFVLTFSDLSAPFYNIQLTSGDWVNRNTTWSITTGTGDAGSFTHTAGSTSGIGSWSDVVPSSGEIVLTGSFTTTDAFDTSTVNFISLEEGVVPEPSTLALLGAGGMMLLAARRRNRRA